MKNRLFEEPTQNNLSHIHELYKESGSDAKNIEEIVKCVNKRNAKETSYTSMDKGKKGDQANLKKEKPTNSHKIPRKNGRNEKALVTKEMALPNQGKTF